MPCMIELIAGWFVYIINSDTKLKITVNVHSKLANAATCRTFDMRFRGVPFRERKSDNNVTVKTPTMTGDGKTNSETLSCFIIKLIKIILVSKLATDII